MKNKNNENKLCFILHTITSLIFTLTGIMQLVAKRGTSWTAFTSIALGVTFGSIAYTYYKKYKEEK